MTMLLTARQLDRPLFGHVINGEHVLLVCDDPKGCEAPAASTYEGERLFVPMIDLKFTKENALSYDLWGLLSESWKPSPEDGVTVFLQTLEKRGSDNRRKRIYVRFDTGLVSSDVRGQDRLRQISL